MFVCLEVDTEDITIWADIDKALAQELGFTHVIWGVSSKTGSDNTPVACILPNSFYYGNCPATCINARTSIHKIIRRFTEAGFDLMVLCDSIQWSHHAEATKTVINKSPSLEVDEIDSRLE